ncbi:MAG: hypothetical protein RBR74_05935 [Ignavibacteriaceae bacterium]|nr:hypothetical protein [Ignavibacteriaceae bacterium]
MKSTLKYSLLLFLIIYQISYAQFYNFGRNKVQYEDFDWKILRTEHFNVYYYGETESIAEIGAGIAEEVFDELKVKTNNIITRKIPLIFYNTSNHFQQTNVTPGFIPEGVGGFFEFLKGRVVIPSTGSLTDFRHVIRHELVHVFMTNKIFRVLRDHRLSTDRMPPLWFVEGLAEYYSTKPDAQAEMVMRDAVLNNYHFGIENIWKISGTFLMYKEGQNFLEFVAESYGTEKIEMMLENFWMYSSFKDVIEDVLGMTIEKIDIEWQYYLRKKYFPLYQSEMPINVGAVQLTDFGFNFSPVHYKLDKKDFIYFIANRTGYSSIFRVELNENMIPAKDPELVISAEQTSELEAFHLLQSAIDISKDGLLAFVAKSDATDAIHFFSVKENKIIKSFQKDYLIYMTSPKFSSNGNRIVFQAVDQKGYSDIYVYDIVQDSLSRLTNDYYDDRDPGFGLNDEIYFSSDRTSGTFQKNYNIFSYNLTTKEIKYITYNQFNNYNPVLSDDGQELFLTSDADGIRNVWKMNTGENSRIKVLNKVTNFLTSAFDPRSMNDSVLIFAGFRDFSFHLYQMNLNDKDSSSTESLMMDLSKASGKWLAGFSGNTSDITKVEYEKEYSLDLATGVVSTNPVFGTSGGAILGLSDMLGDDKYLFLLYNTATVQSDILRSFNIALQKINLSKRVNYGFGVFNFSGNRYDIRESDEFFFERSFGGSAFLSYPVSKFNRLEYTVTLINSDREIVEGITSRKALMLSNSASYVHDNSLWGSSGPIDGSRFLLLLGYTSDIKYSNINYFSIIADYRIYQRLSYQTALALRVGLFYNEGKEARRYFMGGSWDLRGWPRWSLRGEKMWLSSIEFRFPLIDQIIIKFPILDMGFFGIRGATFFDMGSAWDKTYQTTYGSIGAGIRFNLFNVLILRYDIGKKIEKDFTQFQPGLFYQFFFGWDF